jgi:magnesium chelatase family protein
VLSAVLAAKKLGFSKALVPLKNYSEATCVSGIEIIAINSLTDALQYLRFGKIPDAPEHLSKNGKRKWGQAHFRWSACKVVALDRIKCTVQVKDVRSPYWVHPQLTSSQVFNCLVIGHC